MKCASLIGNLEILWQILAIFQKLLFVVLKQTIQACFVLVLLTHEYAFSTWLLNPPTEIHNHMLQIANLYHNFPNDDRMRFTILSNSHRIT